MARAQPARQNTDGMRSTRLLQPLLKDLSCRNSRALSVLDREFPEYPPSSILADAPKAISCRDFAHIYGRTAILLAAEMSGGDPIIAAEEYTSRVDFMLTVLLSSKTLWDAVDNMAKFNTMLADHGVSITAHRQEENDCIVIDLEHSLPGAPASLLSVCVILIINVFSWLAGDRIDVCEIGLVHPQDHPMDPCLNLLDVPIRMGQSTNCIRLKSGTFDRCVPDRAYYQRDIVHVLCHDPGYLRDLGSSFAAQLSQVFNQLFETTGRCPDRLTVCASMGVSPSTLHRHLRDLATSFQAEKIVWQKATAMVLIQRGDAMERIAHALGFQCARSFRRAFVAWTGQLPSAFRNI
jgi:AraC-like DNA-binding protein